MIGRFIGAKLTSIVRPGKILMLFAFGAISMTALSLLNDGLMAMCFILLVGFFNSVMFPTIFTMALENLKDDKPQGSGILCTAIVGGAVIPLLVGACRDASGDVFVIHIGVYSPNYFVTSISGGMPINSN